ncbi:hypothetical protein [Nocardia brevicatena]|uniref:hypothetical protein n=1 Tax=Nocardia brevicatena TaxID=37327 RepID=UPI0002F1A12A|nr:hypothetical protein [Nocardia brevicatena]
MLVEAAVRSIPAMVMQKFHNLRVVGRVAHTFYTLEGAGTNQLCCDPVRMCCFENSAGQFLKIGSR